MRWCSVPGMRWLGLWAAIAVALVGFSVSVGGAVAAPSWSSTFEIASGGSEPSVAIDAAGNAAVAWDEATIKVVRRPAGRRTWSAPTELAQGNGVEPTVTFDPAGHLFAAFGRGTFPRRYVQIATRPSLDGPWTVPITLSNPDDEDAGSPRLAFDPDGDVLVAWSAFDTKHAAGVYKPTHGSYPSADSLGMDSAGDAVAVWSEPGTPLRAAIRPALGHWQPAQDAAPTPYPYSIDTAVDSNGNALAVWNGLPVRASS